MAKATRKTAAAREFDPTPDEGDLAIAEPTADSRQPAAELPDWGDARKELDDVPGPPVETVSIAIELEPALVGRGHLPRLLDIELKSVPQRVVLKALAATLTKRGERLLDGKPIKSLADALLWLVEAVAIELPQPVLDDLLERGQGTGARGRR